MTVRILVVEDAALARDALIEGLYEPRRSIEGVGTVEEAKACLSTNPHIALIDHSLPDGTGLDIVDAYAAAGMATQFIMLTGHASLETAVEALRRGVVEFLLKPYALEAVLATVEKLERMLVLERHHAVAVASTDRGFPLSTQVPAMQAAYRLAERAAAYSQPLLLTGETGTGKTYLARAVHDMSPRADAPFVSVNCAALPESLIESELFGARRGAYTGAAADRKGLVELADGGTLFLDEIGELSVPMQAKLLSVIEDGSLRRLGDERERRVDVRIIAATHVDLKTAINNKTFRADLFFRINVLRAHLVPLRERPEDFASLVHSFLQSLGAPEAPLSTTELDRLRTYEWPGNLRELRNILERSVLLDTGALSPSAYLDPVHRRTSTPAPGTLPSPIRTLRDVELDHINSTLEAFAGNKERAAEALGTSVSTLRRRLLPT